MAGITQRIALKQQAETHSAVELISTFATAARPAASGTIRICARPGTTVSETSKKIAKN